MQRIEQGRGKGKEHPGSDRLFRQVALPVSYALRPFTTVFGRGTGGTTALEPPGSSEWCVVHRSGRERKGEERIERARARGRPKPSTMSTASLQTLPSVHVPPLQRVVYPWSYLLKAEGGLILGRVSRLDAFSASPVRTSATRRCPWQDNRHTGGASIPVLSY